MPKVSVIVPVSNGASRLAECLDSILAQTADDLEVVCIDDGSTDGTPAILASYAVRDGRLGWFSQEGRGLSASCNRGVDLSSGRYLLFCDAGDRLKPDAVRSLVERTERDDLDALFLEGEFLVDGEAAGRPPDGDGSAPLPAGRTRFPSVLFRSTRKDLKEANDRLDRLARLKDEAIAARDRTIAARDRTVEAQKQTIEARNQSIAARDRTIAGRDKTIGELRRCVQAARERIERLSAERAQARTSAKLLKKERDELREEKRRLERSLAIRLARLPLRLYLFLNPSKRRKGPTPPTA